MDPEPLGAACVRMLSCVPGCYVASVVECLNSLVFILPSRRERGKSACYFVIGLEKVLEQ